MALGDPRYDKFLEDERARREREQGQGGMGAGFGQVPGVPGVPGGTSAYQRAPAAPPPPSPMGPPPGGGMGGGMQAPQRPQLPPAYGQSQQGAAMSQQGMQRAPAPPMGPPGGMPAPAQRPPMPVNALGARINSNAQLAAPPMGGNAPPVGPMGAMNPRAPDSLTGAGGASAGAAAAPIAGVIMQYLDRQRQANAARRGGVEQLQQQRAQSLGYPGGGAGIYGAQVNRDAGQMEGSDMLKYLLPFQGGRGMR